MKINVTIPTSWNELSPKQLENIALSLHANTLQIKDTEDPTKHLHANAVMYYAVAKELLRGNSMFTLFMSFKNIPPSSYVPLSKFIFTKNDRTKFVPFIKIKRVKYYAPHYRIKNCTMAEFAFADSVYYQWTQTYNSVYLSLLCASLYRPKAHIPTEEDIRKPFNKIISEKNADAWETVPLKTRLGIAHTFEGCRNHIVSIYPNIFPKQETPVTAKKYKPLYVPFGDLISAKIEYDPSKLNTVQNLLANEFFSIYERELIELKKQPKTR